MSLTHSVTTRVSSAASIEALFGYLPHGLSQFDERDCLVIANRQFQSMYDLPDAAIEPGISRDELLSYIGRDDLRTLLRNVTDSHVGFDQVSVWRDGGRTIAVSCESLPGGGYAVLHEDVSVVRNERASVLRLANLDPLTGLLNRAAFSDELDHQLKTMASGHEIALLILDLDRFDAVNDTFGHSIGDLVLQGVAERLLKLVQPKDIVARFGGDEFAILQANVPQAAGSRILAKRIAALIAQPFDIEGNSVRIGVSIGVAIAPFDAETGAELLKNAHLAVHCAKSDGPGVARYFEPRMDERMQTRRLLAQELQNALANGEFEMFYQPVIAIDSRKIIGVEGLIRWQHPILGRVSPADFIPLAEETGLIIPIGEWVLRQACRDAAGWRPEIRIAVNVSPAQLRDRSFVATVNAALDDANLDPHRLELEITETALVIDSALTIAILTELRDCGITVAMDDFGSGYSSINYLRQFPFDKIKIDGSFISGSDQSTDAAALVRMVAALGNALGVETTAEGVETESEFLMVQEAGCTQVQGYLISKPKPASEIASLLT